MYKRQAQYDTSAKRLLGQKSILAHILVKTVDEFKGMNPKDVVDCICLLYTSSFFNGRCFDSVHHIFGFLKIFCCKKPFQKCIDIIQFAVSYTHLSDEGKSGKSVEGRPEFQRMLDNIENGTDEVQLEHQYKLYLICSILNII